jgi:hypothetical protein
MRRLIAWTLAASAASLCAPLHAQETRVVPLAAYQRAGRFVVGLKPEQVRVKGVAAQVKSLELDRSPRRIVLLLDSSRSMGGDGRGDDSWPLAIQLAKDFLALLQPDDQVALHTFAEKHLRLAEFTNDTAALSRAIQDIPRPNTGSAGRSRGTETNLGLALTEILADYSSSLKVGDTILLISDGEYKGEKEIPLPKVLPDLLAKGVRLLLLRIGPLVRQFRERLIQHERDSSEDTKREAGYAASKLMSDLAKDTGGFTIAPWDHAEEMSNGNLIPLKPEVLQLSVRVAYAFARNSYRLELALSEKVAKNRKIEVELFDEQGREEKHINIYFPHLLAPSRQD